MAEAIAILCVFALFRKSFCDVLENKIEIRENSSFYFHSDSRL